MAEPSVRVAVTVTFLRMDHPPLAPPLPLPADASVVRVRGRSVGRSTATSIDTVGGPHVWWLRRSLPDAALAAVLADPAVAVHVLYRGGEPAGFFELDAAHGAGRQPQLFRPDAARGGHRAGGRVPARPPSMRRGARGARAVTVNTCTADHPRALPNYLRAGFRPVRSVREVWDVPLRLGLPIPEHLRA